MLAEFFGVLRLFPELHSRLEEAAMIYPWIWVVFNAGLKMKTAASLCSLAYSLLFSWSIRDDVSLFSSTSTVLWLKR